MQSGFEEYINLVKSDLYRYIGKVSCWIFLVTLFASEGFKYSFWMRTTKFLRQVTLFRPLYFISRLVLRRYTYKYGIDIPYNAKIGSGFYIGHFGGIIVNWRSIIGNNCNISSGVIIGQSNRGKSRGFPVIGDNVFIGPGAKLIGRINVGNDVAIGTNSVVTSDVPDKAVVVGIPAKIISYGGSYDYINRTDY